MSYVIVLSVLAVEALSLALVWIALRTSMSRVIRPLVAGTGLSIAWGAWVLVLVLRGPLSMMVLAGAVFALCSAAMGYAIHLATVELEGRRDDGGGGSPKLVPEPPGGGNDEPPWWPEFQRQMDAYVARSERERQPVDC